MTPEKFIAKWKDSTLKERSASQSHFNDLCDVLGVEKPTDVDQKGDWYCFERGASKTAGGEGWADVWKRGHFGWEYKGKRKDLTAAFAQLQQYAVALENPPLLVVSDMDRIIVHTNWTNTVSEVHTIQLEELKDAGKRDLLRWVFTDPERLKPAKTIDALTREAANKFASLAIRLHDQGHDPQEVAHFVNRLVFCMFAEDINLLPRHLFSQLLEKAFQRPKIAQGLMEQLFGAMQTGGLFGIDEIEWFNGGLFDNAAALPLDRDDLKIIAEAATLDWSDIDPSIFGTLFERGLDPSKRSQLGAHYTDPGKIMMIVRPVIVDPLLAIWEDAKAAITKPRTSDKQKRELLGGFLERLRKFRVLDPACGSGNFLYLALLALKDLEHRVNLEAEAMGLGRQFPTVGPEVVQGIEINPYAAELARVTVWIGEIQWMRKNGFDVDRRPILKPLKNISCQDALIGANGMEAEWPNADVIIGNPPFIGDRKMIRELGEDYVTRLRKIYADRVPGSADFVCYWFGKGLQQIRFGKSERCGLVSTNSISSGSSRRVLDDVVLHYQIFEAWADEPWVVDGAAVRVAITCFGNSPNKSVRLNGEKVTQINSDLTDRSVSVASAKTLRENSGISFVGVQKNGPFDVPGDMARSWLRAPTNPNGRPNADVLKPAINGGSLVRINPDRWLIDFGCSMPLEEAELYELPFEYVRTHVKPTREDVRREWHKVHWWLHGDARPGFRAAIKGFDKYLLTPMISKHRIFSFVDAGILPENKSVAFATESYATFGILQSRFHEVWSLALCTYMGVGNDPSYSPSRCFETFPFPNGITARGDYTHAPEVGAQIERCAQKLHELRNNWLRPAELVRLEPEIVPGFPDRVIAVDEQAALELKKRTLTNLYNTRPTWLENAHKALDVAVAQAYGWPSDLTDEAILSHLLKLNLERSKPAPSLVPAAVLGLALGIAAAKKVKAKPRAKSAT